ncbi:MAG: histidine phosphatase family protein [Actinobacteria bacterium]|nr:histidine phosphatase family protein [Actinomycetota bacterium]
MAKEGGRTLIIWRHGETDHNASGIWQGQLDTPLSDKGREQAQTAAAALAAYSPSVIVSSDLQRAADTARSLASRVGLPVRYDDRLREIHAGLWQGMTAGDVAEQFPEEQASLRAGEDIQRGIHGESLGQVAERARAAVDELLGDLAPGDCAVIATHGVSGRAVVASLVGLDQSLAWLSIAGLHNCHWAEVGEYAGGWRIVAWNVGTNPG